MKSISHTIQKYNKIAGQNTFKILLLKDAKIIESFFAFSNGVIWQKASRSIGHICKWKQLFWIVRKLFLSQTLWQGYWNPSQQCWCFLWSTKLFSRIFRGEYVEYDYCQRLFNDNDDKNDSTRDVEKEERSNHKYFFGSSNGPTTFCNYIFSNKSICWFLLQRHSIYIRTVSS